MKKLNFILILFSLTILNCESSYAQYVKGSGRIVTETISMNDISSVGLGISADIYIRQGSKQKIEIKGQKNIIDVLNKKPRGKNWLVEFKRGIKVKNHEQISVYITMTELEAVSIGGSGSIISENKFTKVNDLAVSIGGSGDIKLDIDADDVSCSIGGSGNISLKGNADKLKISIGGSGDVKAIDLEVKECKVSSAGSGNVDISVDDHLEVSLVGSGDVKYRGNPKIKSSIVGSGDVKKY